MLKFLKFLRTSSKGIENLLPPEVCRISEGFKNLFLWESKRLGIVYIFVFPFCKNQDIKKCKTALHNESKIKIWFIFQFPFLSWNRQILIEDSGESKCYFYLIQKGKCITFDRRKLPIEGKGSYITHPFSLNLERAYEIGLEGDFAFRMKTHKNFAKAIHQKVLFLQQRPSAWKCLIHKNTYKTAISEAYEFLLKKLES